MTQQPTDDTANLPGVEPAITADEEQQPLSWEERATAAEAKIAETTTAFDELTQKFKSLEGRVTKAQSVESIVTEFGVQLDAVKDANFAVARALQNDDTEALGTQMDAIDNRLSSGRTRQEFTSLKEELYASVADTEGNSLLEVDTAPELAQVRQTWNTGLEQANEGKTGEARALMMQAIMEARGITRSLEQKSYQKRFDDLESQHKAEREKWAEEEGVGDMSLGTGGPAVSGGNLLGRLGDPNNSMTKEEITQAAEMLRKQGIRI